MEFARQCVSDVRCQRLREAGSFRAEVPIPRPNIARLFAVLQLRIGIFRLAWLSRRNRRSGRISHCRKVGGARAECRAERGVTKPWSLHKSPPKHEARNGQQTAGQIKKVIYLDTQVPVQLEQCRRHPLGDEET
jgi:hypothetical protein